MKKYYGDEDLDLPIDRAYMWELMSQSIHVPLSTCREPFLDSAEHERRIKENEKKEKQNPKKS